MTKPLTIGTLARRAGVGVEAIRFYERSALVRRPPRPATGFRAYPEETIARIRFIRQAQTLGFTLKEIAELLALRVAPGATAPRCAHAPQRSSPTSKGGSWNSNASAVRSRSSSPPAPVAARSRHARSSARLPSNLKQGASRRRAGSATQGGKT